MHEPSHQGAPEANPCDVLGITLDASDQEIRAAYLAKVRAHPPDVAPEEFERIRDAYAALSDVHLRIERTLLYADPGQNLSTLFVEYNPGRRFAGPDAWLAVLKERRA